MSDDRTLLHWVFKIASLKESLHFLRDVIGMRVLRHEEFNTGCEATCNGPYSRPWSKTMIGFGEEKGNFVLELTFNYGVRDYPLGDDLQRLVFTKEDIIPRCKEHNYPFEEKSDGSVVLISPDGQRFVFVPGFDGRRERFVSVDVRVSDLARARSFYESVAGMSVVENFITEDDGKSVTLAYDHKEQCSLRLVEIDGKGEVDHAKAFGRLAIATKIGPKPIFEACKAHIDAGKGGSVINEPISLDTPGKATVEVTILGDADAYELCFVGADAFYELAKTVEGGDKIDWDAREEAGAGDNKPRKKKYN